MHWIFGRKLSEKEQARANDRELRAANRRISAELRQLEKAERELGVEIKKLLKAGHREACKVLAKQMLQLRSQKVKNVSLSANISSMSSKNKLILSVNSVSKAIGNVTDTMKTVEKRVPLAKFAQEMREYTRTQDKMEVREEMMTEAMDSALEPLEDDAEDKLIDQVLDEIGLEISEKLSKVPNIKDDSLGAVQTTVKSDAVLDLEKRFAKLNN